ncbi:periplasmic chaperone for outer membrane proteins Skp [Novosphingobium sp. CF614]|uniref:OmpH family outer membrane protein n=1 Tax=Novosphingobium sp. CF614 TaxID=1884364 RepID=UPI0008EA41F0|nr:OmpH family outer membrane protein [Novosphingobium sp. CF614]SFG17642.1 periplasmic chaperone for outer membrane proteins Skp [Novosphingobium sp. CF614]
MKIMMKTVALGSALAFAPLAAQPAFAQAVPASKVAVVDLDRIGRECNACKTANQTLQQQVQAFEARRSQLAGQLQPEAQALDAAVKALNGKAPDAALQTRIQAYQQKEQQAGQELQAQQVQIQRNQAYVGQQIQVQLQNLYKPAMQKRGANMLVEMGQTLAYDPSLDVTGDVLAALNGVLTAINTTAPPPQQQQAPTAPSGR